MWLWPHIERNLTSAHSTASRASRRAIFTWWENKLKRLHASQIFALSQLHSSAQFALKFTVQASHKLPPAKGQHFLTSAILRDGTFLSRCVISVKWADHSVDSAQKSFGLSTKTITLVFLNNISKFLSKLTWALRSVGINRKLGKLGFITWKELMCFRYQGVLSRSGLMKGWGTASVTLWCLNPRLPHPRRPQDSNIYYGQFLWRLGLRM